MISRAIERHGAKKVYEAAYRRLNGDSAPLAAVGLIAETLRDANDIMYAAFASLSAAERASDYWGAQQEINKFKSP